MKTIEITAKEEKRLLELLDKGRAYNDEHYSTKVAEADHKLIDKIKKQLDQGIKKKRRFNCWKCDDIFEATIIIGITETVPCPCCGRLNKVRK